MSLHLNVCFCPTRGSAPRTTQACLYLPVHEHLSNKRQSPKKTAISVTTPQREFLPKKRQFTKNHLSVLYLPVHECLPTTEEGVHKEPARTMCHYNSTEVSVRQEAVRQTPAMCVIVPQLYFNKNICPTRGSSPNTSNVCHCNSKEVSAQRKAVRRNPAVCVTAPQRKFLSNNRQFTKNHQNVSVSTCA